MKLRLIVVLVGLLGLATAAAAETAPYESAAPQAILLDARTGAVFYERDADSLIAPASMSKLMTMIMVFEALQAGKLTMEQEFPISENAWRRGGGVSGGSTMYAELNSKVKLSDLIQGVIVQSANDASIAIAEGMAGSEPAFAQQMTARARELGLTRSTFRNATGLPDPDHRMTVRELAMLGRHIIASFPDRYPIYSQPSFTWNKIAQQNRNPLLKDYPGADGMKTGYTAEAGYGLVGSAEREGRRLIIVIAGLASARERKDEAQRLLDWGFGQFKSIAVYGANEVVAQARVWGGTARWVDLVTTRDARLLLSPMEQEGVEAHLHYTGPLLAPIVAGQPAGTVRIVSQGATLTEVPLQTADAIGAADSMWLRAYDSLVLMVFGG